MTAPAVTDGVPVAEGLFTWPADQPQLIGSFFPESGVTVFPAADVCPKTASRVVEQVLLSRTGTLWSFTVQAFLPKNPPYAGRETAKDFVPYGVGYVQLDGDHPVIVETRLTENRIDHLHIGMPVELVIIPFTTDDDGRPVLTYAFAPAPGDPS